MIDIAATLEKFKKFTIPHAQYKNAIDVITNSIETTRERGTPSCVLMTGESGVGKSSVCKHVEHILGPKKDELSKLGMAATLPCLNCSIPAKPTIKTLAEEILGKLGTPMVGHVGSLEYRIVQSLIYRNVKLCFFDEFHHLATKGAEKTQTTTCDWIKYLLNESGIPICLSGEEGYDVIIDAHRQLARRYPYRIALKPFPYSRRPDSEFRLVLSAFAEEMINLGEFNNYVYLSDERFASAIYMGCAGNMDGLRLILYGAFKCALLRADQTLLLEDFAQTIDNCCIPTRIEPRRNPFLISNRDVLKAIKK
jgi:energy-coupling factor transporter ATP-binding protein EcfA2